MSSVRFFPISWFEDANWKTVQVIGRLENSRSLFLRIGFRPYFTVRYPPDLSAEIIDDSHTYLANETPVAEVKKLDERIYRISSLNREDYENSVAFYEKNGLGEILDKDQDIKSKFFAEKRISPGSWQQASDLKTLLFNVTTNNRYTSTDLEFFTYTISTIDLPIPPPNSRIVFFDLEAIPTDDVSFPDAEADEPPDNIFAISRILYDGIQTQSTIFILTDKSLPPRYQTNVARTGRPFDVTIQRYATEKEMLQAFFNDLTEIRPDRLVSFNGRRFDLNYIGEHVRRFGITLPPFTKILNYTPYFYPTLMVQQKPFPLRETIMALKSPSVSQIDLLDFYRRLYPQLGNHKLETIGQLVLGRGKTGLTIRELFAKYRRSSQEDLFEIIDYSILDSLLLRDLWEASQIEAHLARMANFWKNDAEYVLTHELEDLFEDLLRYITPNVPSTKYIVGRPPLAERQPGIHRNVYLYSLSDIYLTALEQLGEPLADAIADYFQGTNDGIIPFKSGYFPVTFESIRSFINAQTTSPPVWVEENSVAIKGAPRTGPGDLGPLPYFPLVDFIPLIIVANKSWILVNGSGTVFKKGMSSFVRPRFQLLQRYVDYIVQTLLQNPQFTAGDLRFPQFETSLDDYALETKVTAEDFAQPPAQKQKQAIIQQLRELGQGATTSWRRVRYIETTDGPVIEEIYSRDPGRYAAKINVDFYNKKLQEAIRSVVG